MKTKGLLTLVVLTVAITTARAAESYSIVKVVDRADVATFQVMTPDQIKAMQVDIQDENKVKPKALALARDEWAKDKENTKPFPATAIHARSVTPVGMPFSDQTKAQEKCDHMVDRSAAKKAESADQMNLRERKMNKANRGKEKSTEMETREKEKKAQEDKARSVYEKALAEIQSPNAAAGGTNAPAPGQAKSF